MSADDLLSPEDVDESLNAIERAAAAVGADDDFLAALIANQATLLRVERTQRELLEELVSQRTPGTDESGRITEQPSRTLELSNNVPADTQPESPDTVTVTAPFDGRILFVDIHWADGGSGLAGVQFGAASGETWVPHNERRGYLSTADFGNRYPLNQPVDKGDDLTADYINLDTTNAHLVNCFVTIERN